MFIRNIGRCVISSQFVGPGVFQTFCLDIDYCKVVSSNTSHLEAHAGYFSLLMKGIFVPYVLSHLDKKLIS